MGLAAIFYGQVEMFVTLVILIVFLVIEIVAFVNCLTQRADAFPVVGSLSKNAWMAILGGSGLITLLCAFSSPTISIFALVALPAPAIYIITVRPALREAPTGSGTW